MYNRRYTPEMITQLAGNEIFVFGSNLAGSHGGGAARLAIIVLEPFGDKESDFKANVMQYLLCTEE